MQVSQNLVWGFPDLNDLLISCCEIGLADMIVLYFVVCVKKAKLHIASDVCVNINNQFVAKLLNICF